MTDEELELEWLTWSCKLAAPGAQQMGAEDDETLRQAIAKAFERVTGRAPTVMLSGWNGARLNKPVPRRRKARVPADDKPKDKRKKSKPEQVDLFT